MEDQVRDDEYKLHVIDALARLETNMQTLVGNGQPGRIGKLEGAVESLKKWRYYISGGVLSISTLIHFFFK